FYSSAPRVAGGAELAATLGLLGRYDHPKPYTDDAGTLHAMISVWELEPTTRGRISDPGLWPVTTEPFTNPDTASIRWRCFDPNHAVDTRAARRHAHVRAGQQEDGEHSAHAAAGVRGARVRRQPGAFVSVCGHHSVRRG